MTNRDNHAERLPRSPLQHIDPFMQRLIDLEEIRQRQKLILIPSESICPPPVREALASSFTNVYAEGYPPRLMEGEDEEALHDLEWQLVNYRRYADRRFYKGCEFVHEIEMLAKRRAAQCFATPACPAENIYVNVQPLSGAAANNAVYEAFLEPGDLLMGMSLPHGGHLTHGSELNRSGKTYRVAAYGVDPETERLNYDEIRRLAREYEPRLIVAGFTSYPWAPDWQRFREIADEVGAVLLADIAHPAGLVVAGQYPNPVGIADVVTFTTHKTLCGPRGAVIITTTPARAQRIDSAVFPGEQGGPHVNKIAAMAVAFQFARTEAFRQLQAQIVENARVLAQALEKLGTRVCYGGTDTHLLVVDLRAVGRPTGYPLLGEIAARILDLAGLVVNKNTIPGDQSAADARGIRLGTPWATQRGMGPPEMEIVAGVFHRLLSEIHPFTYQGVTTMLSRGKVPMAVLESARQDVQGLLQELDSDRPPWGYPFDHGLESPSADLAGCLPEPADADGGPKRVVVEDATDMGVIEVQGARAWAFLQEVCTRDLIELEPGRGTEALLLDEQARCMDQVLIVRRTPEAFYVLTHAAAHQRVCTWFRRIAEGYVLFDPQDILIKVQGPVRVGDRSAPDNRAARLVALSVKGEGAPALLQEPAEVRIFRLPQGRSVLLTTEGEARALWEQWCARPDVGCIHARRRDEKHPPPESPRPTGEEMEAVALWRNHPHLFDLHKPYFIGQWALQEVVPPEAFAGFVPPGPPAETRRSCLFEEHRGRAKKIAAFAGWEMPIWYRSIQEEHLAVRRTAGLFDVTHMGTVGVDGRDGAHFLDLLTTNYVRWLRVGESQYGYLLDPDGKVLDDLMVYRLDPERYLLVVNAANAEKDLAWLRATAEGSVSLDRERPGLRFRGQVHIRDLKDPAGGAACLVDIALQGSAARAALLRLVDDREGAWRLRALKKTELVQVDLRGVPTWVARTGYTGESIGYELFVHPERARQVWQTILAVGDDLGIVPAGLGARDSLRTEAGLPLYGHELAGPQEIDPLEAGFGSFVKLHKPFFVGRRAMVNRSRKLRRTIVRFHMLQRGARLLHPGDPVIHRRTQQIMGWVTSAAPNGEGRQMGMAIVETRFARPHTPIAVVPGGAAVLETPRETVAGKRWPLHEEGEVLTRFVTREQPTRQQLQTTT
jgi:glycine cleavage system T protein